MISLCRQTAFTAATAVLLFSTGCRVGPKYSVPPATAQAPPTTYKEAVPAPGEQEAGAWKIASPGDAMLRGKWWEIYNEPELNTLEDQLNIDNQNIKVYFANFMAARAVIAETRSQLYPTIGTAPTYTRSRSSSNLTNATGNATSVASGTGTGGTGTGATTVTSTGRQSSIGSLPLTVTWEPDLWGRVRNAIRQDQYTAQLDAADLENERLTEQAALATYYFELRGQDAILQILNETIAADQKTLDYTQAQYELGIGDRISVVEAQNTLQTVQASATNLGVARAQYEHGIAMLIGTTASTFSIPMRPLLKTPPPIPVGMPSQLLERRPDIAAAERSMAAANAQIGIGYAAYYPDLTLSATGGFESSTFKHLFDISSRFWSIGPSVNETFYDAGLRRATINQYISIYNANVATYRQTVLAGLQQVEDGLSSVRILAQQITQQEQAEKSAQEFVDLEIARFQTGIDPYIDVVTAQNTLLTNRQTAAQLHVQQMTASVNLIEALGGGWDASQLPTPAQVSKKLTGAETQIQR
jgi:NodT family efflux transporter outer membrane factor (OMF) lipoprotein